jgi:light-harvesting complex I chlorophyll a/b binding protein 1
MKAVAAPTTRAAALARPGRSARVAARAVPPAGNWLPGSDCPAYLQNVPGSNGFDPLKLAEVPSNLQRYQEAELQHCRWAMLGFAGAIAPEVLGFGNWVDAQEWVVKGGNATWFGISNPLSISTLVGLQAVLFAAAEGARGQEADASKRKYPGGSFNPMGMAADDAAKLKELKNGRLAMVACAGLLGQYAANGLSPLQALAKHVADPWGANVATNGVSIPGL